MPLGLTADQVIAVVGFFLPLFIAIVKREAFPSYVNAIIALVAYGVTAAIVTLVQGGAFGAETFVSNFVLVFGSGTIGYAALWKVSLDPVITARINGGTPAAG